MEIKIDEEKCIGCGMCSQVCEEVFEMEKDGKAQIKKNANLKAECIKQAKDSCAAGAISFKK